MFNLITSSLISALIGLCLPYIFAVFKYSIRRCSKSNLCGEWFSYSFLMENNSPQLVGGKVKISKGVFSLYKTLWVENGLKYKGQLQMENNHLILVQKTNSEIRTETSCIRIDCSHYSNYNCLHGFWLSYDSDNYICCGPIILSKEKLPSDTARGELQLFTQAYDNLIMRVENQYNGQACEKKSVN